MLVCTLAPTTALASGVEAATVSKGPIKTARVGTPITQLNTQASTASENKAAHKAYKKRLVKLKKESMSFGWCCFMDVTGDGIDEMIMSWWPSIYTYKSGKVKRVFSGEAGSQSFKKTYKSKKVVLFASPDHCGAFSYSYLKWNGSKFVSQVSLYTPKRHNKQHGYKANYHIEGRGEVSKKAAKAYAKKLVGNATAKKITYKQY